MFSWLHPHRLESAVSAPADIAEPEPGRVPGTRDRPRRRWTAPLAAALALVATTLGLLLFVGWVLLRGASDLTPARTVADPGVDSCQVTHCAIGATDGEVHRHEPLSRE